MRSVDILSAISAVVFHLCVTLPLAVLTAEAFVLPWMRTQVFHTSVPEWSAVAMAFGVMVVAFALRSHVVAAAALDAKELA